MPRSFRFLILSGGLLLAGLMALWWGPRARGPGGPRLPVLRETGAFSVTNQAGAAVTAETLRGRPWAIDLIFTRCPGPCRQLTGVLRRIQDGLPAGSRAGLLSVTSDPEFDTPAVLAAYAAKFGVDTNRWQFVTGTKAEIRRLATQELLLVLQDKAAEARENPDDLFLHSTLIVVMDGEGRLRTAIEGLEPDAAGRVLTALRALENGE